MFERMMLFQCKGAARKMPGKRQTEKKGREMRGRTWERKELSRMVEEKWSNRDLVKVGQTAEQGTKGGARGVGKDCIVAAKN